MNKSYYLTLLEEIKRNMDVKIDREIIDVQQMEDNRKIEISNNVENRTYLRASEIGECIRKLYFRLIGVHSEVPEHTYPYLKVVSGIGQLIHEEILGNEEIYEIKEYPFQFHDLPMEIHGQFDGYTKNGILVELKTIDDINRSDLPRNKDILQLALYAYVFPYILPDKELKGGELKYISRSKIKMKSFSFSLEQLKKLGKTVVNKLIQLKSHIEQLKVPSKGNEFVDLTQCYFCEFKNICSKTLT